MVKSLCRKIRMSEEEIEGFVKAYKNMYLPYNEELQN